MTDLTEFYPVHSPYNDNGWLHCPIDGQDWPCDEAIAAGLVEPADDAQEPTSAPETADEPDGDEDAQPEADVSGADVVKGGSATDDPIRGMAPPKGTE